ncbi:MAG: MiaB/RimO family radical SAM methylthiotransferase [Luteitalea sp.]|nr:MiaB/RimO family radical SAM methylthiotransferase [Luteitalea sp.]
MKYSVITFGCRVNQADSLAFEEALLASGAQAGSAEEAELIVVNTCSVTAAADQGARQTIRRLARQNPSARIVVTGCYATRQPDDVSALPNVVRVLPNQDKTRLIPILRADACSSGASPFVQMPPEVGTAERFGDGDGSCGATIEPGFAGRTAFTLRVQTGCAEPCSYCIIPTTRGEPRSAALEHILAEVARVTAAGFKEIALTGVHLGSYGRDLSPRSSLVALLEALADRAAAGPAPVLFRISSLEPMDCTLDVVRLVAGHDGFAPHFHLPLQHASGRMLAAMRRPYTIARYAELVDTIRSRMPHAAIGSDIIVGFPGESDADFEQLARYLEGSPITHVHVFPYSDRPGTAATAMNGKVPGLVVRERARRIRDISARLSERFRRSQVGSVHRALTIEDGSLAVTGNYLKVRIPPGHPRNEWVRLAVTGAADSITGAVV